MRAIKVYGALLVVASVAASAALAGLGPYGSWSSAVRVEGSETEEPSFNGASLDGCPFISRDGKTFFMASNRLTGTGDAVMDINIWVSQRAKAGDPWGAPALVGSPISIDTQSGAGVNDFCPTLDRDGHRFFFVSNRPSTDGYGTAPCGGDDMYVSRWRSDGSFDTPQNLGCGVNTAGNEASPSPLAQDGDGPVLYFSSTSTGAGDLYYSRWIGGAYQGRSQVPGVNTAATEGQPNIRRDGLEIFFFRNVATAPAQDFDIFSASRPSTADGWSGVQNLGSTVNAANANDSRPSLSWDGTRLYFGSTRAGGEGSADHYVTTRASVAP
jgi:hypothetical protein